MRKHMNKIIPIVVLAALIFSFMYGVSLCNIAQEQPDVPSIAVQIPSIEELAPQPEITPKTQMPENLTAETKQEVTNQHFNEQIDINSNVINHEELEKTQATEPKLTCEASVRCDTIFANLEKFKSEKQELLPDNGVIYYAENVEFTEGESAFELLLREMRKNNIHIEFEYTPAFDSFYIEGIGNIYEFDCGQMSGWLYMVNGKIASCGCSQYVLCPGDKVEWVYTCNFGADISENR